MFESLQHLMNGFGIAGTIQNLLYCLIGCIVGTIIGVLPGIGPIAGIALLIPATFGLNPTSAIIMLAGIYYGAMYGGSTTSILLNVPGETASVITCIDGYRMAQKGGQALLWPSLPLDLSLQGPSQYLDWSFWPRHWQRQHWPLALLNISP
jgi:TctA family transporter